MSKTGLASFVRRVPASAPQSQLEPPTQSEPQPAAPPLAKRTTKGRPRVAPGPQDKPVGLTVKLAQRDYKKLKRLAIDEGITMQEVLARGASLYLASKGLPPLK